MKILYKTVKVIYNGNEKSFEIWYRNWFMWHFHSCIKITDYTNEQTAREMAIERAEGLLRYVEVWKQSNITYY